MSDKPKVRGTFPFYGAAALSTAVSIDTSWRAFGEVLHIDGRFERPVMFTVVEVGFVACAIAMRAGVRRDGKPGPARWLAWGLCAAAAYMAFALSDPVGGLARVILGPVLGLVFLHLALGIEVATRHGERTGKAAQVVRELRERLLSRLGLADDHRDAAERIRDRAAERAARLATAGRLTPFRRRRLARAVRISDAAIDPARRDKMLALIAAQQHLADLSAVAWPSPWAVPGRGQVVAGQRTAATSVEVATARPATPDAPATDSGQTPAASRPERPQPHPVRPNRDRPPATAASGQPDPRVTALLAERPTATSTDVAALLAVSERTARRRLAAARDAMAGQRPVNGREPALAAA